MKVVAKLKRDFVLKYYFLSFVVALHVYLTIQSGSTRNLATIVIALVVAIFVSLPRRSSKPRFAMIESFEISVHYATVFLAITGIKHFAASLSIAEAVVSLALFFTPALIIETIFFTLDRVIAMPLVHGMSDETCIEQQGDRSRSA